MNQGVKFVFVAGLSGASVVPFAAADWQTYESIYHSAVVSAAYEGLHWSGAEALRACLVKWLINPIAGCWSSRHETEESKSKKDISDLSEKIKAAFICTIESGGSRLSSDKIRLKQELLDEMLGLMLKDEKSEEDTQHLLFLLSSLAAPSEEDSKLSRRARKGVQALAEIGILLTLLGYIGEAYKTVSQLDAKIKNNLLKSVFSILVSFGIVTPAFLGLYMLIIWNVYGHDMYNAAVDSIITPIYHEWQQTKTWKEFVANLTWGSFIDYCSRIEETWQHRNSAFDFMYQQGGTLKTLLLIPVALLGYGSAASVLQLNNQNLKGLSKLIVSWVNTVFPSLRLDSAKFVYNITIVPSILTAPPVNAYTVFPVLGKIVSRLYRIFAHTDKDKAEFMFGDFQKFHLALLNGTHAAMIIKILFDMMQMIQDPDMAESVISNFFAGQTAQEFFGEDFVKVALAEERAESDKAEEDMSEDTADKEAGGINISAEDLTDSSVQRPFSASVERLYHQLENSGFFQPAPPEKNEDIACGCLFPRYSKNADLNV